MMIPADYEWSKMSGPNRRWHRIAADLDRAIAAARLTGPERLILQYVREKTWGSRRLQDDEVVPCAVHATYLAKHWGLCRQNISTALSALIDDRLLVKVGKGYLIGKNVGKWAEGRISPTLMRYAVYGDAIDPEEDAQSRESNPIREESMDIQKESKSIPREEAKSIPRGMRIDSSPESDSIRPHIRNAGASEEFKKKEEEDNNGVPASGIGILAESVPDPSKAIPDPGPRPPATFDELWGWVSTAIDESENLHGKLRGWCAGYRVEWVYTALTCAMASAKPGKLAGYANTCLITWQKKGGPDFDAVPAGVRSPKSWTGGVPPLTPEVMAGRSRKIQEIIDRMPPPPPSLVVVSSSERETIPSEDMARLAAETRALAERLRASNPKRGARRA